MKSGQRTRRLLWRYFLGTAAAALIALGIIHQRSIRIDLVYEGRRLSACTIDLLNPRSPTYAASSNAIVRLGTNAFPFLICELTAEDSRLKHWLNSRRVPLFTSEPWLHHLTACRAIQLLGPKARPLNSYVAPHCHAAVPSIRAAALEALAATSSGPEMFSTLTNAIVSDRSMWCRIGAMRAALLAGADPDQILTLLLTNIGNRTFSGPAVRDFAEDLKTLVPRRVLHENLFRHATSEFTAARRVAAIALPICAPEAESTPPLLQRLAADTNPAVSFAASNSLQRLNRH